MKIVAAGTNPVQLTRGIDRTVQALVAKLKELSKEVTDEALADVATVSAGNNPVVSLGFGVLPPSPPATTPW
jgi:chaperonin GroEL